MASVKGEGTRLGWNIAFWLGAAAVLLLILWLCWPIMPPFIFALAIGYLLDPVADWLQKLGLSRLMATLVILGAIVIIIAVLSIALVPILGHQLAGFIAQLPDLLSKLIALIARAGNWLGNDYLAPILSRLGLSPANAGDAGTNVTTLVGDITRTAASFLNSLVSRGLALISIFSLLIVLPVVAFYILLDWHRMIESVDGLVPIRHRETAHQLGRQIDAALAGFLRGQSLVCLFLGTWYGLGLTVVGLNFGLLIGITGGLLSFVPYIGSLTVLVVATIVAFVQSWPHWQLPAFTLGIVLTGQFLEGNILSPKLVGDKVGVHPVWLIFALLAFGDLLGFIGLVIAVPFASAFAVILRFAISRYRESELYLGAPAVVTETPAPVAAPKRRGKSV
jgi:predicted PurR-regulated permease PerM